MRLQNRHIAFLIDEGFEDLEFWVTVMRLREEGAEVVIASQQGPGEYRGKNGLAASAQAWIKELDPGTWKAGDQATLKASIAVTYYRLTVNGTDVIEIDVVNMKRIIKGVDQLASQRAALGI